MTVSLVTVSLVAELTSEGSKSITIVVTPYEAAAVPDSVVDVASVVEASVVDACVSVAVD